MAQLVTALFADAEKGRAAAVDLHEQGYSKNSIRLVTRASNYVAGADGAAATPEPFDDGLIVALTGEGLNRSVAAAYADAVQRGATFVSVRAPFGKAVSAVEIIEEHDPTDVRTHTAADPDGPYDPAPMSNFLGMPVLTDNKTPFSSFWGAQILLKGATPFSNLLHLPTLINRKSSPKRSKA